MTNEAQDPRTDAQLIACIVVCNQVAMIAFENRWYRRYFARAMRLTNNLADSEDLAQEAILHVFARASQFQPGSAAEPWLWIILRNVIIDWSRKNRIRLALSIHDTDEDSPANDVAARAPTVQEILEAKEKSQAVQNVLNKLNDAERDILLLRYYDGLNYTLIAKQMKIPLGKVGSRLFRARNKFGMLLRASWPSLFSQRE